MARPIPRLAPVTIAVFAFIPYAANCDNTIMRHGIRLLLRSPGFTFVAVMTLATGIGANCLVFSVVDSVLLRQFPYSQPDRLAMVWGTDLTSGSKSMAS